MPDTCKADSPWSSPIELLGGADGGLGGGGGEGGEKGGLGECGGKEGGCGECGGGGSCGGMGSPGQLSSQQPSQLPSQQLRPLLSQLMSHLSQLEPPDALSHVRPCQVSASHESYLSSGSLVLVRSPCTVLPTQSEAASSRSFQPTAGPIRRSSVAVLMAFAVGVVLLLMALLELSYGKGLLAGRDGRADGTILPAVETRNLLDPKS